MGRAGGKEVVCPYGQRQVAAIALRAPCSGIKIKDDKQTNTVHLTDALWKGVGPDEAAGAHIRLPSAPIARALMGRGLMPVQPRRRPDNSRGGGDPPCVSAGRRGPGPRPLRHPSARPRPPRGRRRWVRRRLRRQRKEDWPRLRR